MVISLSLQKEGASTVKGTSLCCLQPSVVKSRCKTLYSTGFVGFLGLIVSVDQMTELEEAYKQEGTMGYIDTMYFRGLLLLLYAMKLESMRTDSKYRLLLHSVD